MKLSKSDNKSIDTTVKYLTQKNVVIIPTDTVYGFSGVVPETDAEIRRIKGREETKPFIQLISDPSEIFQITNYSIPDKLLSKWPGPLTIIVPELDGKNTVAVRCPGDEWLRLVIKQTGQRIYSTSVNRSGLPILYKVSEIEKEFINEVGLLIEDGDKISAVPSTIVMPSQDGSFKIIRQGAVVID